MKSSNKIILSVKENLINIILFYQTKEKDHLVKYLNNLTLINIILKRDYNITVNIEKIKNLESINLLNKSNQEFYDFYTLRLINIQINLKDNNLMESLNKLSDIISEISIQRIKKEI